MSEKNQDNQPIDPVIRAALRARQVPASDSCVDPETLAAWFEGGLDEAYRASVDAHLADCARCQAILAAFVETSEPAAAGVASPAAHPLATDGVVVPFAKPSRLRWLAPVAAGVAAAGIIFWMVRPASDTAPPASTQAAGPSLAPASPSTPPVMTAPERQALNEAKPAAAPARRQEPTASQPKPSPLPMPGGALPPTGQANSNVTLGAAPPVAQAKPTPVPFVVPPPPPPPPATAPPPNPTITADSTLARADRNTIKFETAPKKFPIEFGPPTGAAGGRGGGGAGGGGGGRSAGSVAALRTTGSIPANIRWRILESGRVERTINSGETWTAVALEAPVFITAGTAPTPTVCWLVGREGAVFRSIDGVTFARVVFPQTLDLESIVAQSADRATVSTRDGRTFRTTDGGHTWSSN